MINVLEFIKTVRESFGGSIAVYTMGNCYQFYEILKVVFPEAKAFESGGHVITKINNKYYDIKGEVNMDVIKAIPVIDDRIESLTVNKWSDERRLNYGKKWSDERRLGYNMKKLK